MSRDNPFNRSPEFSPLGDSHLRHEIERLSNHGEYVENKGVAAWHLLPDGNGLRVVNKSGRYGKSIELEGCREVLQANDATEIAVTPITKYIFDANERRVLVTDRSQVLRSRGPESPWHFDDTDDEESLELFQSPFARPIEADERKQLLNTLERVKIPALPRGPVLVGAFRRKCRRLIAEFKEIDQAKNPDRWISKR